MADLQKTYREEIAPKLQSELGIKNPMALPKLTKIVLNMGLKEALKDAKVIEEAVAQLGSITGQKPVVTKAKTAIAGFKLRQGDPIGVMVTLRGAKMYDFLERFIKIVLPRVRDFQGIPTTSFDERGAYSMGFPEISVFPEVDTAKTTRSLGVQLTIGTTARNKEESRKLLTLLGMPFRKEARR